MPYTQITPAHNGAASLDYAFNHGKGHNMNDRRNQLISGLGLLDNDSVSYASQMRPYWDRASDSLKVQTFRIVQSFSREELDPSDPDDVLKGHEIGRETAKKLFPGHQCAIFTQTDGKSGLVHNHLIVSNVDTRTGRAFKGSDVYYKKVDAVTREISEQYVHGHSSPTEELDGERVNRTVRGRRLTNEKRIAEGKAPLYIWQDDLRDRIRKAEAVSSDYAGFEKNLASNGVGMEFRERHPSRDSDEVQRYITYELQDVSGFGTHKIPKNLRSKSYKLGPDFDVPHLDEMFEPSHHKKDVSQSEPVQVEIPDVMTPVPFDEAERIAERIVHEMYLESHPGDDGFDEDWTTFRSWRSRHRKDGIVNIYNKDKTTGLVTLDDESLCKQYRLFESGNDDVSVIREVAALDKALEDDMAAMKRENRDLPDIDFMDGLSLEEQEEQKE